LTLAILSLPENIRPALAVPPESLTKVKKLIGSYTDCLSFCGFGKGTTGFSHLSSIILLFLRYACLSHPGKRNIHPPDNLLTAISGLQVPVRLAQYGLLPYIG